MVFILMKKILHGRHPVVKHLAHFGRSLATFTKHADIGATPPLWRSKRLKLACLVNCAKLFGKII